jgi:two-component system, cell cycle sensor histidine kinase and response regulator CckA
MKPRILIMDDDALICTIYKLMLGRLDCEYEIVPSGEEALKLFVAAQAADQPYRAVILDLTVGEGMGGIETIHALREKDPAIYAVVASGSARDTMASLCEGHGFNASLPKPFRMQDVVNCLAKIGIGLNPQATP